MFLNPTASATPTMRPDHQAGDKATKATRPIAEKHTETKLTKFVSSSNMFSLKLFQLLANKNSKESIVLSPMAVVYSLGC